MKKIAAVLLMLALTLCCAGAMAETYMYNGFEYGINEDGTTITITGYTGDAKTLVVPGTIDGKTVTRFRADVFAVCTSLEHVTIPDSVTYLPNRAFVGCTSLKSVDFPDTMTEFATMIFEGCTGLESPPIPSAMKSIPFLAFSGCTGLKSVTIPDHVTGIDAWAFHDCTSLESVTIPSSVQVIQSNIFENCTGLKTVEFESSEPLTLGTDVFNGCPADLKIIVPAGAKAAYVAAFAEMDKDAAYWDALIVEKGAQEQIAGQAGNLPKTGDNSMLGAWACLLAIVGVGLMKMRRREA